MVVGMRGDVSAYGLDRIRLLLAVETVDRQLRRQPAPRDPAGDRLHELANLVGVVERFRHLLADVDDLLDVFRRQHLAGDLKQALDLGPGGFAAKDMGGQRRRGYRRKIAEAHGVVSLSWKSV